MPYNTKDGFDDRLAGLIENSYKDFHAKGVDYLCLMRSKALTLKAYFLDNDRDQIVMPHNHRYHFTSLVLRGSLCNHIYVPDEYLGASYYSYYYRTPLNGGKGFYRKGIEKLRLESAYVYREGDVCMSKASDIHTISVSKGTILLLSQFRDVVDMSIPTLAFSKEERIPRLEGLYNKMTVDDVKNRLNILESCGINVRI